MQNATLRRGLRLFGAFLLLQALGGFVFAAYLFGTFDPGGTHSAEAQVVQVTALPPGYRGRVSSSSTVAFTTADGRRATAQDPVARSGDAQHRVGDRVTVRYDLQKPEAARIVDNRWFARVMGGLLVVAGLLLGGLGALLWRMGRPAAVA